MVWVIEGFTPVLVRFGYQMKESQLPKHAEGSRAVAKLPDTGKTPA